jgi:RNA polymerase sigma-70 factor, ECF subfamily
MHGLLDDARGCGFGRPTHSSIRSINPRSSRGKGFLIGRLVDFYPFDAEYVRRLRAGEADVQEHFSIYFAERLRLKLRAGGYAASDIDDIIQETFLRTLEKLRGLREADRLGAFVFGICKNICRERRRPQKLERLQDDVSQSLQSPDDHEKDFFERERKRALRLVIDKMKPKEQQLLNAVFFEERDKDEICKQFGVTRPYLRVCICRVKKALKRRFLKKFDDKNPIDNDKKDH